MLSRVSIRNFGTIESLDFDLGQGFTVITGESGAGKSMFLSAIDSAFSERVDRSKIRHDAASANITLEFDIGSSHRIWSTLSDMDVLSEPEELMIVSRTIPRKGSVRTRINGVGIAARQLNKLGNVLIDFHQQHGFLRFLEVGFPRALLDAYVDTNIKANVRQLHKDVETIKHNLANFQAQADGQAARKSELTFLLQKFDHLSPEEGEFENLCSRRKFLLNAEKIASLCNDIRVYANATEFDENMGKAQRALDRLKSIDGINEKESLNQSLANVFSAMERSLVEFREFEDALGILEDGCIYCPKDLEFVESRFQEYTNLGRQLNLSPKDLARNWAVLRDEFDKLTGSDCLQSDLVAQLDTAYADWRGAAKTLSESRADWADKLTIELNKHLADLKLKGTRVAFRFSESVANNDTSSDGLDTIELIVFSKGSDTGRPLRKSASGGEMARISLALSIVEAQNDGVMTQIYDEADHGVNGAVAASIGKKLAHLGKTSQILAITHSPQVAVCANTHIGLSNASADKQNTKLNLLKGTSRVEEIAGLISGQKITDEARAAARKLLEVA